MGRKYVIRILALLSVISLFFNLMLPKASAEIEKIPSLKTTATNKADGGKEMHAKESITIQDKVEYTNLVVGKEYTVKGKLMNKVINKPLLIDGKEVTAETKFTAKEKNGFVTLDFPFVGAEQQGREVVVFEELYEDGILVATHADINDVGQTVRFVEPTIKTTATNKADGGKEMHAKDSITIQDKVEYKDLIVGKEYVVKGKLMNKVINKPLLIDGKEVTAETKFTAKEKNGFVTLDFPFVGAEQQGREVVVFEEVYQDGVLVAIQSDINDVGQTVRFVEPTIKTTATNKADGGKEMHAKDSITIQNKVEYKDLIVGKEYVVKGKLMNKVMNKPLLIDGKEVKAETKFTAKEKNGFVTLDFPFVGAEQQGREVVVFEEVYQDGVLVAIQSDINDVGQTVRFVEPTIKTAATNKADGGKEMYANESVTIQDKVEYKDLIVGKEYVAKGKLMDKATKKPLLVDDKEVAVESKFTAKEKNGSITLDFTFNASKLQGKEVVVFEELYQDDILVAINVDIEDAGHTVKFKEKKLGKPQPEKPQSEKPQSEQPKTGKTSKAGTLPATGGNMYFTWFSVGAGLLLLTLGAILFMKRRNA
ncbi:MULTISPECIES: VaFE repeat-containing surface-anchored protein [Bacillus cereus group]|uniref:VaFE repeat-containing surface-anchored protein n=1 Tax=Bacillus cereus group TaxID=86661 RepID=UPI000BF729A6|nr:MULTISPECIES: VaFE repeat-containing surface-anchored protein [Bacillus cereus group]MCQ6535526.1 VaFE repeat-containing surface-anchored protein [Bacillus mycoides]PEU26630.1 adhesin [Bacillus wiedmannii]PHA26373.1 adhesin [Bacillus wiedmannii]PHB09438.1 adhesin [Bacillus wiedmannii]QWI56320.1 LPXTG cell wall anchor domain-containing protein [Bacillus mycoides]